MGAKNNLNSGGGGFPGGGGGGGGLPGGGGKGTNKAGSPGLITSTGGLLGTTGLLLTPAFNQITVKSYIINHDATNFDCEEDAEYDYRQEANFDKIPGEGRTATFHLVILKYREIGKAKFNINITVFNQALDDFETTQIPVNIPSIPLKGARVNKFPDNRIHTIKLTPPKGVIQGERPQVTITRKSNSGPFCVTKLILCGNADEAAQQ